MTILLLSLLSLFLDISAQGDVSEEAQNLALKWAPFIWLHPEEKFFPVSPEFVIENVEVLFLLIISSIQPNLKIFAIFGTN